MSEETNSDVLRGGFVKPSQEEWEENHERDRGIFTDIDRQFLFGLKQYNSETGGFDRRREIRERFKNGIIDLALFPLIAERDRERIIEELHPGELWDGTRGLIEFALEYYDGDVNEIAELIEWATFSGLAGEWELFSHDGGVKNVEVDIDVEWHHDSAKIYERFQEEGGHILTPTEIGILVRDGLLDAEEVEELGNDPFTGPGFRQPPGASSERE